MANIWSPVSFRLHKKAAIFGAPRLMLQGVIKKFGMSELKQKLR